MTLCVGAPLGCCSLATVIMQAPAASEVGMPMLHLLKTLRCTWRLHLQPEGRLLPRCTCQLHCHATQALAGRTSNFVRRTHRRSNAEWPNQASQIVCVCAA